MAVRLKGATLRGGVGLAKLAGVTALVVVIGPITAGVNTDG